MREVYVILCKRETQPEQVMVLSDPQTAGMEAAVWLDNGEGDVDGYVPDLVNAATDGDDGEFVSDVRSVRIFKAEVQ